MWAWRCLGTPAPAAFPKLNPTLKPSQFTVSPFGVAQNDFEFVRSNNIRHALFERDGSRVRWVYAGRVGPDMYPVLNVFFRQLARLKKNQPDFASRLQVLFVGTNYSPAHRTYKVVEPLARECGVEDLVTERIIKPLNFPTIRFKHQEDVVANRAAGYVLRNEIVKNGEPFRPKVIAASGGILATATDLARWWESFETMTARSRK